MEAAPLILVVPGSEANGPEFYDYSVSLSEAYLDALLSAGGLPLVLPLAPSEKAIAEIVRRADGVMLTGGDDIQPELYTPRLTAPLRAKVSGVDPKRDLVESLVIKEVFARRKPLLAICRGHQMLNVALGGTLIVDIPSQVPDCIPHGCLEHKDQPVHEIRLKRGSLLAHVFGREGFAVNSSHHQAVDRVAAPFEVTGRSEDGIVEVMELRPEDQGVLPYLLSVQFHPERLVRGYPEFLELFRSFVSACALNKGYEGKNTGGG